MSKKTRFVWKKNLWKLFRISKNLDKREKLGKRKKLCNNAILSWIELKQKQGAEIIIKIFKLNKKESICKKCLRIAFTSSSLCELGGDSYQPTCANNYIQKLFSTITAFDKNPYLLNYPYMDTIRVCYQFEPILAIGKYIWNWIAVNSNTFKNKNIK